METGRDKKDTQKFLPIFCISQGEGAENPDHGFLQDGGAQCFSRPSLIVFKLAGGTRACKCSGMECGWLPVVSHGFVYTAAMLCVSH